MVNDKSFVSAVKHLKDLIYLETNKADIIEAINNSSVFSDSDNIKEK